MSGHDSAMPGRHEVDLVVNCYERTVDHVLAPDFFRHIERQNKFEFSGIYVVINNVEDRALADEKARMLVESREITGYVFVDDALPEALRRVGLSVRSLGRRRYFLDYALVMATTGTAPYVLGWDAELSIQPCVNWIGPGVDLLERRSDVFSAAPAWPARSFDTLSQETVTSEGDWALNWAFSDQCWLVRRAEVASPIYHWAFAPASLTRHANHPKTFEARMERYQRSRRRYRASLTTVRYETNDLPGSVVDRLGDASRRENLSRKLLGKANHLLDGRFQNPRWRVP